MCKSISLTTVTTRDANENIVKEAMMTSDYLE